VIVKIMASAALELRNVVAATLTGLCAKVAIKITYVIYRLNEAFRIIIFNLVNTPIKFSNKFVKNSTS